MFRVSVNKKLQSNKRFLKELFDAIILQVGTTRIKKVLTDQIDTIVNESLNDILLPAIRQNLVNNKSMFTTTLYNYLQFTTDGPGRVVLDAGPADSYASILEKGSQPRQVDSAEADRIIRWVIFKRHVTAEQGIEAAQHVVSKIEKTGNNPHPYIEPAMELMMPIVKDAVQHRLSEVLGV
jgi:hypothetical protein